MLRSELIPQTSEDLGSGRLIYHFSLQTRKKNAPQGDVEHQIAFFEVCPVLSRPLLLVLRHDDRATLPNSNTPAIPCSGWQTASRTGRQSFSPGHGTTLRTISILTSKQWDCGHQLERSR